MRTAKGHSSIRNSRSPLRKILVFAQFAASGILLVLALVVSRQFQFIKNADLGMKPDNTVPFWVFMAGGALALAIAFLTVGARVIRAAAENPIEALRVE